MTTVKRKKDRRLFIASVLSHPKCPKDFDIIDRGSEGVRFISRSSSPANTVRWWLSTIKEAFPEGQLTDQGRYGHNVTMPLDEGVGLKINKNTGELKIKGPGHWEWFVHNISPLLDFAPEVTAATRNPVDDQLERQLGIQLLTADSLLSQIPACGCIKEGPLFTYTLWKSLLDFWFNTGGVVSIVTPQMDAERLADILILMLKNRGALFTARLFVQDKCDGDYKFDRVKSVAQRIVESTRVSSTGKRMFSEEKIAWAVHELRVTLQPFNTSCNFIGWSSGGEAEVYTTSARFHKAHFVTKSRDFVAFHRMTVGEYTQLYLDPLAMEYQTDTVNGRAGSSVGGRWQSLSSVSSKSRSIRTTSSN